MTPADRAERLRDLVARLTAVLDRENTLLDHPRSSDLGPIVTEKQGLFADYEAELTQIGDIPGFAAELEPEVRQELLETARRFETALQQNERKLEGLVRSSHQIMKIVSEAARKLARPISDYGRGGSVNTPRDQRTAPVAIDQTL